MWGIIISIISGALMSVQGVFNTQVTKKAGFWVCAAFVQITAFAVCVIMWFVNGRQGSVPMLFSVDKKYMLTGGIIGAFITYTVVKGIDYLGTAKSAMFIITSQLIVAYLIELFGLFGMDKADFSLKKLAGVVIICVGIVIFKWGR